MSSFLLRVVTTPSRLPANDAKSKGQKRKPSKFQRKWHAKRSDKKHTWAFNIPHVFFKPPSRKLVPRRADKLPLTPTTKKTARYPQRAFLSGSPTCRRKLLEEWKSGVSTPSSSFLLFLSQFCMAAYFILFILFIFHVPHATLSPHSSHSSLCCHWCAVRPAFGKKEAPCPCGEENDLFDRLLGAWRKKWSNEYIN